MSERPKVLIDGEVVDAPDAFMAQFVADEKEFAELARRRLWQALRTERDRRLAATDWTQLSDAPIAAADKQIFVDYRKALRDLPSTTTDPEKVAWPEVPTSAVQLTAPASVLVKP